MSIAPDIRIDIVALGGGASPVRTYYTPHCHRCGWTFEPAPTKDEAQLVAAHHLRFACLSESTQGALDDPLPGDAGR